MPIAEQPPVLDRDLLVRRLEEDLLGPLEPAEVLQAGRPSDVYLTGILWPLREPMGGEEAERLDSGAGADDETQGAGEEVPLTGQQRPCSAGLSFAVAGPDPDRVAVTVEFALYSPVEPVEGDTAGEGDPSEGAAQEGESAGDVNWQRRACRLSWPELELPRDGFKRLPVEAEGLPGGIDLYVRTVSAEGTGGGPCRLVTITLINGTQPPDRDRTTIERYTLFQVALSVAASGSTLLVPKPDILRRGDAEVRAGALLYRECPMYAVGHTCSARWETSPGRADAALVGTTWLPRYELARVSADGHALFRPLSERADFRCLEAAWLADASPAALEEALTLLVTCYEHWISLQRSRVARLPAALRDQAEAHLLQCEEARDRMSRGIARILGDPALLESFRLANLAIQRQHEWNPERRDRGRLQWRPFQLAFMLLAGPSACDASSDDRAIMDLLWFPTGGGKTEAYLGLIALVAFYRRLSGSSADDRAGVAAVMRYTLRLLTTQQFVRASALILACESLRRAHGIAPSRAARLGARPFSIGLWLGGDATPNSFEVAERALRGDTEAASPVQLLDCPCCQSRLTWLADPVATRVEARCPSKTCTLGQTGVPLPVFTVDTDVYTSRPTLFIGTIDKFAQLPRREEVRPLFGLGGGDTPDLVIQDELHLISGPLGTIAGLYEVAFDWLTARNGRRAKIIGSTATIRRANDQARALFNRDVAQFPPPGLDHLDSGFAVQDTGKAGRLYVGVTTAGRSAKFALQSTAGCLLQAAAGELPDALRRDPYATLVTYFNSLRELGGALVLMQDDVADSIQLYSELHGEVARRADTIEELTSRRTQEEVRDMLKKLTTSANLEGSVDVVLATNMVSVGVDIPRLGLMLVNGQPKTRSEYIQATSRVGRDQAPGLIVSVLNSAKPRDRSHYESFPVWHQSLYRDVEATSVTPFAARARDCALRAVLVTMLRHSIPAMHSSPASLEPESAGVAAVIDEIVARAAAIDPSETTVAAELREALLQWEARRPPRYWHDRQPRQSLLQSAERAAALKATGRSAGEAWPTLNNMRSVEPTVPFKLQERLRERDADPGAGAQQP